MSVTIHVYHGLDETHYTCFSLYSAIDGGTLVLPQCVLNGIPAGVLADYIEEEAFHVIDRIGELPQTVKDNSKIRNLTECTRYLRDNPSVTCVAEADTLRYIPVDDVSST